jgi:hypothetical protein
LSPRSNKRNNTVIADKPPPVRDFLSTFTNLYA